MGNFISNHNIKFDLILLYIYIYIWFFYIFTIYNNFTLNHIRNECRNVRTCIFDKRLKITLLRTFMKEYGRSRTEKIQKNLPQIHAWKAFDGGRRWESMSVYSAQKTLQTLHFLVWQASYNCFQINIWELNHQYGIMYIALRWWAYHRCTLSQVINFLKDSHK